MKWKLGVLGLFLLAAVGTGVYHCRLTAAAVDLRAADLIAAAVKNQEAACGPSLEVRYIIRAETVKDGQSNMEPTRRIVRYVRTPEVRLWDRRDERIDDSGNWNGFMINTDSYNMVTKELRTLTRGLSTGPGPGGPTAGAIVNTPHWAFISCLNIMDPAGRWSGGRPLYEQLVDGKVSADMEEIHGSKCWRVDVHSSSGLLMYRIWVDPAIGFNPRRIDHMDRDKKVTRREEFHDYRNIGNGVYFPNEKVITNYTRPEYDLVRTVHKVDWVRIGQPLSPDELMITFPKGTIVDVDEGPGQDGLIRE